VQVANILITIEKFASFSGDGVQWSNSYAARVSGDALDGDEARNLALNLLMFENHLHLPSVNFKRICIRVLPYEQGASNTFRAFMPQGRANGLRIANNGGEVLPFPYVFTVKKQTGHGRSGHLAYHGVLTSCDISVNSDERFVLRGDSDLCGQRMAEARYIMLNQENLLLVPGATADFQLVAGQRFVNFLSQGSVSILHGLNQKRKFLKQPCKNFQAIVNGMFDGVCDAVMALQVPPKNIEGLILVDPVRWTYDSIVAGKGLAKSLIKQLQDLSGANPASSTADRCAFGPRVMDKMSALHKVVKEAENVEMPDSSSTQFLKTPGSTRPPDDLDAVLVEVQAVVSAFDEFRSAVTFLSPEAIEPPPLTVSVIERLSAILGFFPCDEATSDYQWEQVRRLSRDMFVSAVRDVTLEIGRAGLGRLAKLSGIAEFTPQQLGKIQHAAAVSIVVPDSRLAPLEFFRDYLLKVDQAVALLPSPPTAQP
jgi:hypothetical protein